ncbi:MAG TPA: carboxypeptidase-like regulatory domain-containing protein, partial [Pyrinomonadaceae bacterium]|nr:carboxypeptidase-like regulatory domain-containing protein [Pyrinomonadaceae bacterium]
MFTFTAFPQRTKHIAHLSAHLCQNAALKRSISYLALLVLSILLVPAATRAQVLYGSLVGNVTDPNGAAVSGAKVEIANVATGDVTTATTDDRGAYSVNDLQAGVYKVSVSRSSFKTTVKADVRIEANRTARFDTQLEIGGLEETVLVTAGEGAMLQTDRADVNLTQSAREINNLPLFGSLGRN